MQYLIVLIVLAVAIYAITGPLRAAGARDDEPTGSDQVADLEAARDAKYREIRDAELDVGTGKLSEEDHAALDGTLRAEAIEILNELDQARAAQRLPSAP